MTGAAARDRRLGAAVQDEVVVNERTGWGRGRGRGQQDEESTAGHVSVRGRGHGHGSSVNPPVVGHGSRATTPAVSNSHVGFSTGEAGDGGRSRGPEVPLPTPAPHCGKPNDATNIWCHGKSTEGAGWVCGYCQLERRGGGATRFKQHLAAIGVDVNGCMNAPHYVVNIFRKHLPEGETKRRKIKEGKVKVALEINHGSAHNAPIDIYSDADERALQRALQESLSDSQHGRSSSVGGGAAGSSEGVRSYFDVDLAYSKTRPQQTIEGCIKRDEYSTKIGRAWSKWFHANDIPGHKANCPYFIGAIKLTQDLGKAGILEPAGHYKYNFGKDLARVKALTAALKKMTSPSEFVKLIPEIEMYINFRGSFGGMYPEHASSRVSSTQWWISFGDSTPLLQKYALRIVSQCTSSSGCERNWSLFALVHTTVRNRLGFERLHKMVFCHHNLGLRIREILDESREKEVDPFAILMDVSLHDSDNPIMDWLATSDGEEEEDVEEEYNQDGYASPCPVVLEVVQRKRRRRGEGEEVKEDGHVEEEEDDGDEVDTEEEEEDDVNKEDNNDLPRDDQPLARKSLRKKTMSVKLLSAIKAREDAAKKI